MVQRFDVGKLDRTKRTGAGGARMPATIARTGVQVYRRADGREVREYRPATAVFAPESLASLASIPVTIGHPGTVTPDNWRRFAVGHVAESAPERRADGQVEWLEAQVVVNDAAALSRVSRGELVEVSMGYTADVLETPGTTPDGQHYDAVQANVQFNHLALLPAGQARAGAGARLRLDSKGNEMLHEDQAEPTGRTVKVDGIDCPFGSETHVSLLERQIAAAKERADAAGVALKAAETATGEANAKLSAATAELTALKARDVNALVQDELSFRDGLRTVLPAKYDFTGKSREQVRLDALGAEVAAEVAKQPEGERAGFANAMLKIKLDAAAKAPPANPGRAYVTPEVKADAKPVRKDPRQAAFDATWSK